MRIFCKVKISKKEKRRRIAVYSAVWAFLAALFIYGSATVYVNSYNIMHSEPMVVFEKIDEEDGISVVILNHKIKIF